MAQNMKRKILELLTKLGDRDTYPMAANELESIARTVDSTNLQAFLSSILSTDSSDKPAVRKHCVYLISVLSLSLPPNSLSPFLPRILTQLSRRLRDMDSSIRSSCVATVSTLASRTTKPPFSSAFLKPLSDILFTEQETNAQIGAALCLAAAIDAAPDPDPGRLGRVLMPRLEKLVKCEGFKAKAAGLVVIGSVIGSGGVSGTAGGLNGLVACLLGFLSSEDWAARKAAAESLGRLAVVERESLADFKAGCLKVFESRKYDKVKAVREVMNQMMEAWKQVPDVAEEESPLPRSHESWKEDASDGRHPAGSKIPSTPGSGALQTRKKTNLAGKSTPPDSSLVTSARKRSILKSTDKKLSPAARMLNCKKPLNWEVEVTVPSTAALGALEGNLKEKNGSVLEKRNNENTKYAKGETKRSLLGKISDEKIQKFGGSKSGARVAPCHEESPQSTVAVSNMTENHHTNHKDCEDLSLIRNQLVQIEQQQSSLLDMLQQFIGSSQNGMRSLETRVHGLELALDEISYDLAVSTGRMPSADSRRGGCCLLPAAYFLSSKFWKKTDGNYSASRFSASTGTPSVSALHYRADKNGNNEPFRLENPRPRLRGAGGFIVNPLAEIHSDSRGCPGYCTSVTN